MVAPGADPAGIRLRIDGPQPARLDAGGTTASADFPVVNPIQPFRGGPPHELTNNDAFVARVASSGSSL